MRKIIVCLAIFIGVSILAYGQYSKSISFATMLNGVTMDYKTGKIKVGFSGFSGTFLDGVEEGALVVKTVSGDEIKRFKFVPSQSKKPYYYLNMYGVGDIKLDQGDYIIEFYATDELFYTYPFSVTKKAGDNPFEGGDSYYLEGDWEKWGYFLYSNADKERNLVWKIWLRTKEGNNKDVDIEIAVKNDASGKTICTSRPNTTRKLKPDWIRFQFDMVFPPDYQGRDYFKAKHLLETDGNYTMTMKIDGNEYGKWKFAVKDGKFAPKGRTVRGEADPLTFIEGGLDAFWFEKE